MANEQNKTRKRRIAAVLLVLLALFIIGAIYLSLVPIELTRYHSRIESMIEVRTGRKVVLDRIVLQVLPSPDLRLKGVKAYQGTEQILNARSVRVRVSLIPLMAGNLKLQDLDIEDAAVFIRRDDAGNINLLEFIKGKQEKPEEEGKGKFRIESLTIAQSRVKFIDEMPEENAAFDISGIKASLTETSSNRFSYRLDGRLLPDTLISFSGQGDQSALSINGNGLVHKIELARMNPYIQMRSKDASIKGTADIDITYSADREHQSLTGNLAYNDLNIAYPAVLTSPVSSGTGHALLAFDKKAAESEMELKDIALSFEDFDIKGAFRVSGPQENRNVSFNIETTPVPLTTVKALTPLKVIPKGAAEKISNISPLSGDVTVKSLSASGTVDDFKAGKVFKSEAASFNILLNDLRFKYKGLKETFSGIKGSIAMHKAAIFTELSGRYNKEVIDRLRGRLNDLGGSVSYTMAASGSLDAAETLNTTKDLTASGSSPVSQRLQKAQAAGTVGFDVNASGSLKGKTPLKYSGSAEISDGALAYKELPISLEYISGKVDFDNKAISTSELALGEGSSSVKLSGSVGDYRTPNPSFDIKTQGTIGGDTISKAIAGKKIEKDLSIAGLIPFKAEVKGRKDSFSATALANTTPANIEYKDLIRKTLNYPVIVESSISLDGKELTVKSSSVSFGKSLINASGNISLDRPVYKIRLRSEGLRLTDLDNVSGLLEKDYESGGMVSFSINALKQSAEGSASYNGEFLIREGRFVTPFLSAPVERVNAQANFDGNTGKLVIENLAAGQTEITGKVELLDIAKRAISFDVSSPRLFIADLMPKKREEEEEKPKPIEPEKAAPPLTGSGKIRVASGELWNHPFTDFATDVKIEESAVKFSPFSLNIDNGTASGYLTYFKDPTEPIIFDTGIDLSNIDLKSVISGFGAKSEILSGDARGRILLSGRRGAIPFASGLNGEATFYSEKGKLWKFPILSNIFSIVNIISITNLFEEGLEYKTLAGDFFMNNGILSTNNLSFDSDSMRMSAVGEIDTTEETIDTTLVLHPFVTIDKIISNIPLAGWIIAGKDESAVSLYFQVEGPLKEPEVNPLPAKSVEKNVFGVLERLIKAPFKLFE
ncbi:MAG: AsmA-like C-terminal domain-containing protein [Deltaproteobacteria bacterium]|nr:AsmA-like C-terminal domain-containing protein [Deltaproteobacteria bacterium]